MTVGAFHHFMSLICVLAMTRISGILAMEMETMGKPWGNYGKPWATYLCSLGQK